MAFKYKPTEVTIPTTPKSGALPEGRQGSERGVRPLPYHADEIAEAGGLLKAIGISVE